MVITFGGPVHAGGRHFLVITNETNKNTKSRGNPLSPCGSMSAGFCTRMAPFQSSFHMVV